MQIGIAVNPKAMLHLLHAQQPIITDLTHSRHVPTAAGHGQGMKPVSNNVCDSVGVGEHFSQYINIYIYINIYK